MKAYLSGAIENAPEGGKAWRGEMTSWLKKNLGHEVFNPALVPDSLLSPEEMARFRQWRFTDYPRFETAIRKLIQRDLEALVRETDYVICYWDRCVLRGGGTHGEVTVAYYHKIPVYTVLGMPLEDVSSWILGCSTRMFDSFEQLKVFLGGKYGI